MEDIVNCRRVHVIRPGAEPLLRGGVCVCVLRTQIGDCMHLCISGPPWPGSASICPVQRAEADCFQERTGMFLATNWPASPAQTAGRVTGPVRRGERPEPASAN